MFFLIKECLSKWLLKHSNREIVSPAKTYLLSELKTSTEVFVWEKVFKNGPCQILLGQILNTLSHFLLLDNIQQFNYYVTHSLVFGNISWSK